MENGRNKGIYWKFTVNLLVWVESPDGFVQKGELMVFAAEKGEGLELCKSLAWRWLLPALPKFPPSVLKKGPFSCINLPEGSPSILYWGVGAVTHFIHWKPLKVKANLHIKSFLRWFSELFPHSPPV